MRKEWSLSDSEFHCCLLKRKKKASLSSSVTAWGYTNQVSSDVFYKEFYPVMTIPAVLLFQVVVRECFLLAISKKTRIFWRFGIWTPFFFFSMQNFKLTCQFSQKYLLGFWNSYITCIEVFIHKSDTSLYASLFNIFQ